MEGSGAVSACCSVHARDGKTDAGPATSRKASTPILPPRWNPHAAKQFGKPPVVYLLQSFPSKRHFSSALIHSPIPQPPSAPKHKPSLVGLLSNLPRLPSPPPTTTSTDRASRGASLDIPHSTIRVERGTPFLCLQRQARRRASCSLTFHPRPTPENKTQNPTQPSASRARPPKPDSTPYRHN